MISLGGIVLNNSMVWNERYSHSNVAQTMRRTLGGLLSISAVQLIAGAPITLQATESYGWLTRDQVLGVLALAEDPAGVYTLLFGNGSYQVRFRHHESPAVDFSPFVPRTDDHVPIEGVKDYMIGAIKLITV